MLVPLTAGVGDHMGKSPRSAAAEPSRVRVVLINDFLKQQLLDLVALRKKVAEAERRCKARQKSKLVA